MPQQQVAQQRVTQSKNVSDHRVVTMPKTVHVPHAERICSHQEF